MAFARSGAYWRQMRKLCATKLFSRRRAETWLAVREGYEEMARDVAGRSGGGEAVNLGELVFKHTVGVVFRAAFGIRGSERGGELEGVVDEFVVIFRDFSKLLQAFHIGDFFPWLSWVNRRGFDRRLRATRGALCEFLDKIIDDQIGRAHV